MSETSLPFLAQLGLDTLADEHAIRRAYAQRLKRIDQAHDAPGFQALREAYEAALHWAAWRQRQATAIEAQVETVAEDPGDTDEVICTDDPDIQSVEEPVAAPTLVPQVEPAPAASAESLSLAVIEELVARLARFETPEQAGAAMVQALSDDRLVNLDARTMFEWRVACLLTQGWQPGHDLLFAAACDVFHWEEERRALRPFGSVGAHLDQAIGEAVVFTRYPIHEANAYRRAIRRLRQAEMPGASELRQVMPALRILAQRHPNWLRIVCPQATLQRWNEVFQGLPLEPLTAMPQGASPGTVGLPQPSVDLRGASAKPQDKGGFPLWVKIIFVLVVLHALTRFATPSHTSSDPQGTSPWYAPVTVDPDQGSERPGHARLGASSRSSGDPWYKPVAIDTDSGSAEWPGRTSQNADGNLVWEATRAASAPPREPVSPRDLVRRQREAEEALAAVLAEGRGQPASAPR